jgi:hypothetical protein
LPDIKENLMHHAFRFALLIAMFLTCSFPAWADSPKRFAVLPFAVHGPDQYAYLGQGIQTMLTSRLKWAGRFEDLDRTLITQARVSTPVSREQAQAALAKLNVDYLIYGSLTILGEQVSLDMFITDRAGQTSPQAAQVPLDDLIPTLERIAENINSQIFGRPQIAQAAQAAQAAPQEAIPAAPLHPDLIRNEHGLARGPHTLSPAILYSGAAETPGRWRSQSLPFSSLGMVVGDADGNGKNEIFVLTDNKVMAYHVLENRLMPLAEYTAPIRFQCLNINLLDINRDGIQEIIVSAIMEESPLSFVLNFVDGKFTLVEERIPFYLNVVRMPPEYSPTLIGQRKGQQQPFDGNVHEVLRMGGKLELGRMINLPREANVFNFAYLPQDNDYKLIIADKSDRLRIYSSQNAFQAVTDESYAGSALGLMMDPSLPGIKQDPDGDYLEFYYIPSRLVPVNLSPKGERWDLLVNRNISMAAQFFARYRYFPQGEIHALFWDGINLNINWKTQRIRGTVVDYGLADMMNDGGTELFVLVNTHPGVTGFTERRTIILSYTLNLEGLQEKGATVNIGLE